MKKLIALAKKHGLSAKGRKQELIERIAAFEAGGGKSVDTETMNLVGQEGAALNQELKDLQDLQEKEESIAIQDEIANHTAKPDPRECALCLHSITMEWKGKAVIEKMVIVLKADSFPTTPLVLKPCSTCHQTSTDICRGCFISNQQLYTIQFKDQVKVASKKANDVEIHAQSGILENLIPAVTVSPSKIMLDTSKTPLSLLKENNISAGKPTAAALPKTRVPRPYKAFDEEHVKNMIRNSPVKSSKRVVGSEDAAPSPAKRSKLYDFTAGF